MRIMIIKDPSITLEPSQLEVYAQETVTKNTFPPRDNAITIIDSERDIDWSWPDIVIVVGTYEIGRHHADLIIGRHQDFIAAILDFIEISSEADADEF